jgi:hypothetical protein
MKEGIRQVELEWMEEWILQRRGQKRKGGVEAGRLIGD